MSINILRVIKEQIETNELNQRIANLTEEEKENINKIINFAIAWWLKEINDGDYNHNCANSSINLEEVEKFKYNFGVTILKKLLSSDEDISLHCGYFPDGLLAQIIQESDSSFLRLRLPSKSTMTINKEQIWIKEGSGTKTLLAFDINKVYELKKENNKQRNNEQQNNEFCSPLSKEEQDELLEKIDRKIREILETEKRGEYYFVDNFVPSNYDFVDMYISNLNAKKSSFVKKRRY